MIAHIFMRCKGGSGVKKHIWRIAIGAILLIGAMITGQNMRWLQIALFAGSYIVAGGDVIKKAIGNIIRGNVFDENFLMSIATIGAILIGEYPEGIAVMLFYQVGELFQSYAIDK